MTDTLQAPEILTSAAVWTGDRAPLAKALVAAQVASEAVKKASKNDHFKSKYADLAAVVEAVVPALNANGVAVMQFVTNDDKWVSVETMFLHESGASVASTLSLKPTKTDPQGVASASTYARRYSLLGMSGAAPEDDDGNAASAPRQQQQQPQQQKPVMTLKERADTYEASLKAASSLPALDRLHGLAKGLRDDLDRSDPERLSILEGLYDVCAASFDQAEAA